MSDAASWQRQVSFSDRHANVQRIQKATKQESPFDDVAELVARASAIENIAFTTSDSQEEYTLACERAAAIAEQVSDVDERRYSGDLLSDDAPLSPAAEAIGPYKYAHSWRDGLFSFVYKANVPNDGSAESARIAAVSPVVALKVTTPSMMTPPHDLKREARILGEAASPNIVQLLDTFQMAGGRFVLVFPFKPLDLERALRARKLSANQAKHALRDMFQGLTWLHSKGILHRDVKPSNILLDAISGPAYLADFGIAWSPSDQATEPTTEKITDVGTTSYRPPELLFGNKAYDWHLDQWAAGCVVAEAASLWPDKTLFDSGDLGSELALIQSIFRSLGTPNLNTWPEAAALPDWGKMEFKKFPPQDWCELLPKVSPEARDLVSQLVRYESGQRLSAEDALKHKYFAT